MPNVPLQTEDGETVLAAPGLDLRVDQGDAGVPILDETGEALMTEGGDFIWMDLQFPEPIRRDAGTGFRTSVNMTHYV